MIDTKDVDRKTLLKNVMTPIIGDQFVKWLEDNGFLTAPASTKYHGNYEGGLFDHSFATMNILVDLSIKNELKWQRPASPFIIGMLHDLCKIDNYIPVKSEEAPYKYNTETDLKGHGDKSVMMLASHIQLTEEEVMCIRYHMGAFTDKEEWNDYTRAVRKYPNVLWTHQADMLSSHVLGT
jgi:23S rRNA maturation-related 3'-5' exoribonuclease YhaM